MVRCPVLRDNEWNAPAARQGSCSFSSGIGHVQMHHVKRLTVVLLCQIQKSACRTSDHRLLGFEIDDALLKISAIRVGILRDGLVERGGCGVPNFTCMHRRYCAYVTLHKVAQGTVDLTGIPASQMQNAQRMIRRFGHSAKGRKVFD